MAEQPNGKTGPWVNAASTFFAAVSALAAAASLYLASRGLDEQEKARLSTEQVTACREVSNYAASLLVNELQTRWSDYHWDSYTPTYTYCFQGETEQVCRERQQRETARRADFEARAARIQFENARQFAILGSEALAASELELTTAIDQLGANNEDSAVDTAERALMSFRETCASELGGFAATPAN